jgi:hypothetical protein
VTGPSDPVGGRANDDDAVPDGESHGEDVEAHVGEGGTAPPGETLEAAEVDDIERQVTEIVTANQGRGPNEQVSVRPEDVN